MQVSQGQVPSGGSKEDPSFSLRVSAEALGAPGLVAASPQPLPRLHLPFPLCGSLSSSYKHVSPVGLGATLSPG